MRPQTLWQEAHAPIGSSKHGTGMNHRAEQVGSLLRSVGTEITELEADPARIPKRVGMAVGLRRLWVRDLWRLSQLPRVGRYGRRLAAYRQAIRQHSNATCVVWGTPMDWVVPIAGALEGLPVVAMPNDLDALAPRDWDGITGRGLFANLKVQAELFAGCMAVVCISREEQWLLSCLGVQSDWLPYYPSGTLLDDLMNVRERRGAKRSGPLLMIVALNNPSNRSGIRHLLDMMASITECDRPKVRLVGYGTEELVGKVDRRFVDVLGTVSDEQLAELMVEARAMLIYQHTGSGALTRIPEALVAGVPVICNGVAARSAYHYDGVYTFETSNELAELLGRDLPTPAIPPRPESAERRFIDTVRKVVGLPL